MKAYCGSGGIAPRILDLGTRWRWVVSFMLRPLYPGEIVPGTHWIGGWMVSRTGLDAVVKRKIPSFCRDSSPRTPIVQPVSQRYTTELYLICLPWDQPEGHYCCRTEQLERWLSSVILGRCRLLVLGHVHLAVVILQKPAWSYKHDAYFRRIIFCMCGVTLLPFVIQIT
jgi:hypothetical protein